jgi:hypothetical protein
MPQQWDGFASSVSGRLFSWSCGASGLDYTPPNPARGPPGAVCHRNNGGFNVESIVDSTSASTTPPLRKPSGYFSPVVSRAGEPLQLGPRTPDMSESLMLVARGPRPEVWYVSDIANGIGTSPSCSLQLRDTEVRTGAASARTRALPPTRHADCAVVRPRLATR